MLDRKECFIQPPEMPADQLLADWQWLIGDSKYRVLSVTAFGDTFLVDEVGQVHFLDTLEGTIRLFATSEDAYREALDDRHTRRKLLMSIFIEELREAGIHLQPNECYSPDVPPKLGGSMEVENYNACDWRVHLSVSGQIFRQLRDLPPGTKITDIKLNDPGL